MSSLTSIGINRRRRKKHFLRRSFMSDLNVTDLAVTKLKEYMQANNIESALRVALMQGGWSGPSLGLALDEPKDSDKVFENDTLKFLVEDSLMSTCGGITVDYVDAGPRSGFGITSVNPISSGGGCSSGSCGSGSCGWCNLLPYKFFQSKLLCFVLLLSNRYFLI